MASAAKLPDLPPRPRRYVPRLSFSDARGPGGGREPERQYLIVCGSHVLMSGRTFNIGIAEDICAALEEAHDAGAEEAWEA